MIPLFSIPFYVLRHGETEANALGIIAGALDSPLTAHGHEQAEQAAAQFAAIPVTAIYTSNLSRAVDTAIPIAMRLGLPVQKLAGLAERHWGELEGQPIGLRNLHETPSGGESLEQFHHRILQTLACIPGEGCPLIVAHSGVVRVLRKSLLGHDPVSRLGNGCMLHFVPIGNGHHEAQQQTYPEPNPYNSFF